MALIDPENLDLPRAVRHGEARPLGQPRDVTVGLQEDAEALGDGDLVGLVPGGGTALEHVVLRAAHERQLAEQRCKRLGVVVHAAHDGALVHRLRTGLAQQPDRLPRLARELAGVIEVIHDVDLRLAVAVLLDQPQQARVVQDPMGIECGHLGADPDDPYVRHGGHVADDGLEPAGGHDHGIAAGEQHVGDLLVLRDVVESRLVGEGGVVVVVHEQPLAEAVAAVRAADLVHQEQRRVAVLVLAAADRRVARLVAGVELAPVAELALEGHDESPQRVVRIVPVDEVFVVVVEPENVALGYRREPTTLFVSEAVELR